MNPLLGRSDFTWWCWTQARLVGGGRRRHLLRWERPGDGRNGTRANIRMRRLPVRLCGKEYKLICGFKVDIIQIPMVNWLPTSRYSAMCSQASSSWFSSRITSNISGGHWANFSAATICTDKFLACDLPRDLIKRCKTCTQKTDRLVIDRDAIQ